MWNDQWIKEQIRKLVGVGDNRLDVVEVEELRILSDGSTGVLALAVRSGVIEEIGIAEVGVLLLGEGGEAPFAGDDDVLTSGELVLGTTQSLGDLILESILGADGEEDLVDSDTGAETVGLSVGVTHTGLKPISTGAGKHLVDSDDVVGVSPDTEVETLTTSGVGHVSVDNNSGCLESFGGDLLQLTGHEMDTDRELVDLGGLASDVIDGDLGIRYTTEVARLDVRLVLAVAVATSGT